MCISSIRLFVFTFILCFSNSSYSMIKHFPLDKYDYKEGHDIGIKKYKTNSLHGTNKIVLTFDDGPNLKETPKILDLLKKFKVKASFFINTINLTPEKIEIAYRILDEGHILASHDFNHRDNNQESEKVFKKDLARSVLDISRLKDDFGIVNKGMYFRFPFGYYGMSSGYHHMNAIREVSQEIYGENCINFVFWDIDTKDWGPGMSSFEIAENVKSHMLGGSGTTVIRKNNRWIKKTITIKKPLGGGVVLLHDRKIETSKATEMILKMANNYNWEIVPLSDVKEFSFLNKNCSMK